ncbi:MAG: hypothetical protein JXB26_03395 [Candidatus Aminicenantes bacterium]|nr:hypothetical protein [Candidatus Aminicenantes bacterium]
MKKPLYKNLQLIKNEPLFGNEDLFGDLAVKKGWTTLFLGKFSLQEVYTVMEKRNFTRDAQKRKLWPLDYDLDSSQFPLQRFRIYYKNKEPENMIVDLKIREGVFQPKKPTGLNFPKSEFLILDWLTLQNPLKDFTANRSPLPGQKYPGLSLGRKILDLFVYLGRLLKKDGLLAFPAYFHNAVLFSRGFIFVNPEKEAEVAAIHRLFKKVHFKDLAWIVYLNCLQDKEGRMYEWKAEEQVYPFSQSLKEYFTSKKYEEKRREAFSRVNYKINWDCYEKMFPRFRKR